ncbi:unnamed protein product [Oikopleura dioica]|uniref:Uncharacterized protein n=1 Tax=Oikopleura dioica TaxID=34765 RepID=E4YDD7_OIKDI|nr:unnamed protein product [Oikopleura dioica]
MTEKDGFEEISCPYLNALRARALLSIAYLICVILHFFRVLFKPYTCPSMIILSTSLGVGLAFLLCGSVSLNAGFHYVLVVLIFTIIHIFFTYGSFFWHKRVTERSGEELKGWTIIANTQGILLIMNALICAIWQLPNIEEIETASDAGCETTGLPGLNFFKCSFPAK